VKSKVVSCCEEQREAGQQGHMRLMSSKTEFALMMGVFAHLQVGGCEGV